MRMARLMTALALLGGACLPLAAQQASAWPAAKPVRVVVSFTAGGTPAQFGQFVQREYEKWKVIVLASGARAE